MNKPLEIMMPIKTVSEANSREHWRVKNKRKREQQDYFALLWRPNYTKQIAFPCCVTFTRYSCKLMDSDNLAGAFKGIRDQLAKLLGIDDGSQQIKFIYKQVKTIKREHYFTVKVENL